MQKEHFMIANTLLHYTLHTFSLQLKEFENISIKFETKIFTNCSF